MLMIWSSLARNRSFNPVVSCFFGRIVPSDAAQNHAVRFARTPKMKLQGSGTLSLETLQSRVNLCAQNRLSLRHLAALHGRQANINTEHDLYAIINKLSMAHGWHV